MIIGYFDGACEPKNPNGNMGIGAIAYRIKEEPKVDVTPKEHWHKVFSYSEAIKFGESGYNETSNNVAEYLAITKILEYLVENKIKEPVLIYGDSNLVVRQLNGDWKIKKGIYQKYAIHAIELFNMLPQKIRIEWIPREMNCVADELSKAQLISDGFKIKNRL